MKTMSKINNEIIEKQIIEIDRLKSINKELVEALELIYEHFPDNSVYKNAVGIKVEQALAKVA